MKLIFKRFCSILFFSFFCFSFSTVKTFTEEELDDLHVSLYNAVNGKNSKAGLVLAAMSRWAQSDAVVGVMQNNDIHITNGLVAMLERSLEEQAERGQGVVIKTEYLKILSRDISSAIGDGQNPLLNTDAVAERGFKQAMASFNDASSKWLESGVTNWLKEFVEANTPGMRDPFDYSPVLATVEQMMTNFGYMVVPFLRDNFREAIDECVGHDRVIDYLASLPAGTRREVRNRLNNYLQLSQSALQCAHMMYELGCHAKDNPIRNEFGTGDVIFVSVCRGITGAAAGSCVAPGVGTVIGGIGGTAYGYFYDKDRLLELCQDIVHADELVAVTQMAAIWLNIAIESLHNLFLEMTRTKHHANVAFADVQAARAQRFQDEVTELAEENDRLERETADLERQRDDLRGMSYALAQEAAAAQAAADAARQTREAAENGLFRAQFEAVMVDLERSHAENEAREAERELVNLRQEALTQAEIDVAWQATLPVVMVAIGDGRIVIANDDPVAMAQLYADKPRIIELAHQLQTLPAGQTITV